MQALNQEIIEFALRLADKAGEIQRRYWRMPVQTVRKADASPVTLADQEVEEALRVLIEQTFPKHGIIGEEYGNVREDAALQWVIDPIDGTRSFIGGYPLFTSLIALCENKVPVLGIIDQPISRERWVGIAGKPTTLNGKPIGVRNVCNTLSEAVIATTSVDYFKPEQLSRFMEMKKHAFHNVLGGDAYAYAMMATGQTDLVVDAGLKPFDYCALKPVIEGAGGIVTDWNGRPITLAGDGRVIAAATSALHKEALAFLS